MTRSVESERDIVEDPIQRIDSIYSVHDETQLDHLQQALDDVFLSPHPEGGIDALFRVFERFPNDDGYGIFWTILHGLERLEGYEAHLVCSVRRVPMEFNLTMINRLLNAGVTNVAGTSLLDLLHHVANTAEYTQEARDQAQHTLSRHHAS